MQQRCWDGNTNDTWSYSWGSCKFSSKKAYKIIIGHTQASPLFNWLWASSNLGKHKFFFWLLLRDRLNTRNLLRRKNMELEDYNCVLCNTDCEETSFHLFFECPFSTACWNTIPINWNTSMQPLDMVIDARTAFGSPTFREIFITTCWTIWVKGMQLSLMMGRLTSTSKKDSSGRSLALFAQRPNRVDRLHSSTGRRITSSTFFLSLGLVALYFQFLCCFLFF